MRALPAGRWKVRAGRLAAMALGYWQNPVCLAQLHDGTLLVLDPRSRTEGGAFWNGVYDRDLTEFLASCCEVYGDSYYDIGANVGLIAIPLARSISQRAARATVVAFEPVPENYERLVESARINGVSHVVDARLVALGSEPGVLTLTREAGLHASTGNAVPAEVASVPGRSVAVAVRTLDSFWEDIPPPAVMKIDVEGLDVAVVRGSVSTITASRPIIAGEFNNVLMPRLGFSFLDAAAILTPLDYRYFSLDGGNRLVERLPTPDLGNVVAVPAEKVATLPSRVLTL